MLKSYKYRIYPNFNQKILLEKHFGCVRFVYNQFLNERIAKFKKKREKQSFNILNSLKLILRKV